MDERIDVTKRKPRRLRGTPASKFVNRAALITLTISVIIGVATTYRANTFENIKAKYGIDLLNVSEKEKERRALFTKTLGRRRTTEEILAQLKAQEDAKTGD